MKLTTEITTDYAPRETLDALAVLVSYRGATASTVPTNLSPAELAASGVTTVWTVLADTQESGYDLDNRTGLIGVYGCLAVAVADVYRQIIMGESIYNPTFTEQVVQTVAREAAKPVICEAGSLLDAQHRPGWYPTQDGCDYDGDAGSLLSTEDVGPF
jgi:hypothetical protein